MVQTRLFIIRYAAVTIRVGEVSSVVEFLRLLADVDVFADSI